MTEVITDELRRRCDVRIFDIGKSYRRPGAIWGICKAIRSCVSAVRIATWRRRRHERLYLVLNATGGLIYNIIQAAAGRLGRFPMVVHHHVWVYISEPTWQMKLLLCILGKQTVHVVACPEMANQLESAYARKLRFAYLTPGIVGLPQFDSKSTRDFSQPFVLGLLSNLTLEKGVGEAIELFERLRELGRDVKLVLAGPIAQPDAGQIIHRAIATYGDGIEYLGPVYGNAKAKFFADLDAFVFPTRYRNESWGIVLNESLMAGVPVLVYKRGCTGYLVGGHNEGGLVVTQEGEFVVRATEMIVRWLDDPSEFESAKAHALKRGGELRDQAQSQLRSFIDAFRTDTWPNPDGTCSQ